MKFSVPFLYRAGIAAALLAIVGGTSAFAKAGRSEGADLVFGGVGTGPGEFTLLRDFTFDPQGNIYALEAGGSIKAGKTTEYLGVARVQKFDEKGEFIREFPLGQDLPADKTGQPGRLAVDGKGNTFVTFQMLGFVRQYDPEGRIVRDHPLPGASGVALGLIDGKERVAAIGGAKILVPKKGWEEVGGDEILLLDPNGGEPQRIALPQKLGAVQDMAIDDNGHFYVLSAAKNSIYVYDGAGKLIKTIGAGSEKATRNTDGSEPLFAVDVDSKGNIYTLTWGNPGLITMYTADGKNVIQRPGRFTFPDGWYNGNYSPMAVAPNDRLWMAAVGLMDPTGVNFSSYHFRPAIIRPVSNFLDPRQRAVKKHGTLTLGLAAKLESKLPFGVTHDFAPIQTDLVLPASNRNISEMDVTYHVYDLDKNVIGKGDIKVPLENNVEARVPITVTPSRYGWYTVEAQMRGGGESLGGVSSMFGVTPRYENMPVKIEDFKKGWDDSPRQMFCGLNNVRLAAPLRNIDNPKAMDVFEKSVADAEAFKTTWSVQLTDKKEEFTPEKIRPLVERFKGRIRYYELFNEPNFSMGPKEYVALAAPIYKMIKEVDPEAKVMGPSVCGIQMGWYKGFYEAGGAKVCDILTIHDYEGNDSISPEHWRWKFDELRKLMAEYGDASKDIWQTERCIHGLRTIGLVPGAQAVRVTLHRDLLQTLGIPPDHNNLYYLNEGGYIAVPSYVWSGDGPHPAALALRTREAMTKDYQYSGTIDFGPSGNNMLMGLQFKKDDGSMVLLRNLGTSDIPLDATVKGGNSVEVSDAFGNVETLAVKDGKLALKVPQLPLYLKLGAGQTLEFPKIDLGNNIAPSAKIIYEGKTESSVKLLQNGIIETIHAGHPNGDTAGTFIWKGEILNPNSPQGLELRWSTPRTFDAVFLHGVRADNIYCALLDYDLQVWLDGNWKTLVEQRTAVPPTDPVAVLGAKGMTWLMDNNFWVNRFDPVTSDRLRVVFRRASFGLAPDEISLDGRTIPSMPMLREIEVFAPVGKFRISAHVDEPNRSAVFDQEIATVKVTNSGSEPLQGTVRAKAPEGWSVTPSELAVKAAAGASESLQFQIKPPAVAEVGSVGIDFVLNDASAQALEQDTLMLNISSPLLIIPHPPGGFDKNKGTQSVSVMLKNQSKNALSGTLTAEAIGPQKVPPVEVPYGPIPGGEIAHQNLVIPGANPQEGAWVVKYSTTIDGVSVSAQQDLSVRQWSVVGAFGGDVDTVSGPETDITKNHVDTDLNYTDMTGGEQKWQTARDDAKGRMDLYKAVPNVESGVTYAVAWIFSPKAQKVLLSAAFNSRGKIWVNGELVMSHVASAAFGWGQKQAEVSLKEGNNLVLVKVAKDYGQQSAFLFDLLDPATRQRLPDLKYSPKETP
jgi:hypothetical protein